MIDMEVQGMRELRDRLSRLPDAIQRKIVKGMVATGAAVFREEAERRSPVYTGSVQKGHPPPGTLELAIYQVRVREECVGTREVWKVSAKKGPKAARDKKGNMDAYYASWVEYGTAKMAARPYMRPAFELQKDNIPRVMGTYMAFALPAVVESL